MSDQTDDVKAREIGWRPKEEFRGDPEKWVDASEYLRRGEEVLPLVKAANKRLEEKTGNLEREITRLTAALTEQRASMDEFATFNREQLADKLAEQRRTLTRELRAAKEGEDETRIEELEERLDENTEARAALKAAPKPAAATPPAPPAVQETTEYRTWAAANPWYGGTSKQDIAKTAAAQAFATQIAAAGKTGQAFFDAVDAEMQEVYPTQRRADPTEDARPSGGGGGTGSPDSSFNSLPADAKAQAKAQAARFVGPNKMFKDEKAWFKHYAEQYRIAEGA